MATQDDYQRITVRIPPELHAQLTDAARDTSKSVNAEIVGRLEASFQPMAIARREETEELIDKAIDKAAEVMMRVMEKRGWTPPPLEAKPTVKRIPRSKPVK